MKNNKSNNLYYIYIDTKILGAFKQLINYFQSGVFNNNACIAVYVKYYKENSEYVSEIFGKKHIPYKFIKRYSDISLDDGKVVFYLFNAQSNCRMVAFRNVSHIFITHGESNKKSSVKPIIRIYDYVVTSGEVGIDRYLKAGIFSKHDISDRLIKLGNTFVGQNSYCYDKDSDTLLYAPTWEGGVPDENFSSVTKDIDKLLLKIIVDKKIKKLVIQIHPNLGHRDRSYRSSLKKMLEKITKKNIVVLFVKESISIKDKLYAFYNGFRYILSSEKISISYAITDISAMEVQLLVKKIPTMVLANRHRYKELVVPNRIALYYLNTLVHLDDKHTKTMCFYSPDSILPYIESYQESSLKDLTLNERVEWLCEYTGRKKILKIKNTYGI